MTVQVLLDPSLVAALYSEVPLQDQLDEIYDAEQRANELPQVELPENLLAARYDAMGMSAKAEQHRQGQAVPYVKLERPQTSPMTMLQKEAWQTCLPEQTLLSAWTPQAELPEELASLLERLHDSPVFHGIAVWETTGGPGAGIGVMLVGIRGDSRFHAPGETECFPIARWTTRRRLSGTSLVLARRQARSAAALLWQAVGLVLALWAIQLVCSAPEGQQYTLPHMLLTAVSGGMLMWSFVSSLRALKRFDSDFWAYRYFYNAEWYAMWIAVVTVCGLFMGVSGLIGTVCALFS